jgi:adenine-specific DNA-methyltransferase
LLYGTKKDLSLYKNPDNDINGNWTSTDPSARTGNTNFKIKNPYTGKIDLPPKGRSWAFSEDTFNKFVKSGKIKFKTVHKKNERGFIYKRYELELKSLYNLLNSLDGVDNKYMNQVATKEKNKFLFMEEFDYPKPEEFLKLIIESSTKENDLIIDFFGGSGTTCAVAHKINRQYIMIEQMYYIHNMPETRMKEVIKGEQGGISKSVNWQGGGEFIYLELDKYNQKFIDDLSVANKENIMNIYDEICQKGFLNYDIDLTKINNNIEEFKALELEQQKEFLLSILNKNQLYKNLSEIEDETLEISNNIKELNKDFYNV